MPSTEHGMGHTGGLGCLWPSLSSGTITPGVPLGPGQARPWGKHRVTGKSSRRRKPAAGSSQGGRQRSPGCGEQRRVCRARRALSAPSVSPRPLQVCLGRGCPPVPRHTRPCRGFSRQGWPLSRSTQRFKLSGCRSLGTASENIPKCIPDGDEGSDETEGRDEGLRAVRRQQDVHPQLTLSIQGGG